jgi:hypothetical protein
MRDKTRPSRVALLGQGSYDRVSGPDRHRWRGPAAARSPLEAHAVVLSVGETSQTQALDRTQPGLPKKKGRLAGTMTRDYKRHGTTTLCSTGACSAAACSTSGTRSSSASSTPSRPLPARSSTSSSTTTPPTSGRRGWLGSIHISGTCTGRPLAGWPCPLSPDAIGRSRRCARSQTRLLVGEVAPE